MAGLEKKSGKSNFDTCREAGPVQQIKLLIKKKKNYSRSTFALLKFVKVVL